MRSSTAAEDRFARWFPFTAALVQSPEMSLAACVVAGVPLAIWSIHLALAPLYLWIFIWALRFEELCERDLKTARA